MNIESAEIMEIFQWKETNDKDKLDKFKYLCGPKKFKEKVLMDMNIPIQKVECHHMIL